MPADGEAGELREDGRNSGPSSVPGGKTRECGGRSEQLVVPRPEELQSDHPPAKHGDWSVRADLRYPMGYTHPKQVSVAHPKFKVSWAALILSGSSEARNRLSGTQRSIHVKHWGWDPDIGDLRTRMSCSVCFRRMAVWFPVMPFSSKTLVGQEWRT